MVHRIKTKDVMAEFKIIETSKGTFLAVQDNVVVAETKSDKYNELFNEVAEKLGGKTSSYKTWAKMTFKR